jgi:hypothetical protein
MTGRKGPRNGQHRRSPFDRSTVFSKILPRSGTCAASALLLIVGLGLLGGCGHLPPSHPSLTEKALGLR